MPKGLLVWMLVGCFGAIVTGVMFADGRWPVGIVLLVLLAMQGKIMWRRYVA